ncbi:hypothetical protein F511_10358 [Dorcoceras hygrometricum]|uniref:Uncharacterized protein n=1 Tax=Dorcoceras hygrometricum TaxID=472368 RepID=A0A2Z7C3G8_9LAMI|nr:hypothetical protein F511_10358 [Dorcoceras hygrometricum]
MAAPLLARPCANGRALVAQRPANDATLLRKCCAVLRQGWSTFSHGCTKLAHRAWRSAAAPRTCRAPRPPHARTSALAALGCTKLGDAWRRFTRGDRALVVPGGLLGRSLLGAGWRLWRMKCAAAGRPICAERRSLRAAVRRAAAVRKFRVAPPPAAVAPAKLRRWHDGWIPPVVSISHTRIHSHLLVNESRNISVSGAQMILYVQEQRAIAAQSLFKKKKKKISFISTVDESIDSRNSRRRRSVDGAGTKKFSRKLQIQQITRGAKYGMSCDDISLDVITISSWLSADEAKCERLVIAKRCRLHKLIRQRFALAIKIQQEDFALLFQQTKLQCSVATQRHPVARRFRRSFWTTRRKQQQHPVERLFESAVAIYSVASYSVQSQDFQAQRIEVAKCSSRSNNSAVKQLTYYQSWMSTAELNSKWRKRQKPAKEKDTSTVPLSVLYRGALH